jgi:CheY-like chemotaxis protein
MPASHQIALLSNDLMFPSAVAGVAAQFDAKLHVVGSVAELTALCEKVPLALAILDLAARGFDVADVVAQLRQSTASPTAIVAYGPHVHAEKLAAARAAGCDEVVTRGQFHGAMAEVIAHHLPH